MSKITNSRMKIYGSRAKIDIPPYIKKIRGLKIESEILYNKYNKNHVLSLKSNGTKIIDDVYNDIVYNKIYYSTHENSLNEPFIVVNRFANKNNNSIYLTVQFLYSRAKFVVPYNSFITKYIQDPYSRNVFGKCAIGNIVIDATNTHIFNIWYDMMSRCFNPNDLNFKLFGMNGAVPLIPQWTVFELFYQYIYSSRELYKKYGMALDSNDIGYYYFFGCNVNRDLIYKIGNLYTPNVPNRMKNPSWVSLVPLAERENIIKQTSGEILPRHADASTSLTPMSRLYHLNNNNDETI